MSITSQAVRLVQTMRYESQEAPRLRDSIVEPVAQDDIDRMSSALVSGTLAPNGTAERLLCIPVEDDLERWQIANLPERTSAYVAAAIRTAREIDAGFLPDDDRTVMNRLRLDVAYSDAAAVELKCRAGTMIRDGSASVSRDLMGPSADAGRMAMRGMGDADLKRMAAGHFDGASRDVRRAFANDAVTLASSGSYKDRWDRRPVAERRLEAPVLLAAARAGRSRAER